MHDDLRPEDRREADPEEREEKGLFRRRIAGISLENAQIERHHERNHHGKDHPEGALPALSETHAPTLCDDPAPEANR